MWVRLVQLSREQLHYESITQNVSLNCIFMNVVKVAMAWLHVLSVYCVQLGGMYGIADPGAPSSTILNTRAVFCSRLPGLGRTGIDGTCGMLGLPPLLTKKTAMMMLPFKLAVS